MEEVDPASPTSAQPLDGDELAAWNLFGGEIATPIPTPFSNNSLNKGALVVAKDPLDLMSSNIKTELDSAFMEDDAAKLFYLKCQNVGLQCISVKNPEYTSASSTKSLIWTLAPFIPVAKEQLVSAETFARMVLSPEAYEACEKAAFEHVVKGKTWHPTLQGGASALHPHPGVLCSCQVLGTDDDYIY